MKQFIDGCEDRLANSQEKIVAMAARIKSLEDEQAHSAISLSGWTSRQEARILEKSLEVEKGICTGWA